MIGDRTAPQEPDLAPPTGEGGWGAAVVRRRPWALGGALLGVALAVLVSMLFGGALTSAGFTDPGDESERAAALVADEFGRSESGLVLVVTPAAGVVTDAEVAAAGRALTERLAAEADVTQVLSFWTTGSPGLRSEDGRYALVLGRVDLPEEQASDRAGELADEYRADAGFLRVGVTGQQVVADEVGDRISRDLLRAEIIALPVAALLLGLYLRRVRAALVPLLVAGVVVVGAVALLTVLAAAVPVSVFATNLVIGLGLGLAIDYCLLVVARYREELTRTADRAAAMTTTLRTAGRTVVFSGATVGIALLGLLVYPFDFLRSMAYAGLASALLAVAVPLLVLPAVLVGLGPRVTPRGRPRPAGAPSRWGALARWAARHRVPVTGGVVVSLLLLAGPALGLRTGFSDDRVLPESSATRQAAELVRAEFSGAESDPLTVVLGPATGSPPTGEQVADYAQRLSALPDVARVDSAVGSAVAGRLVSGPSPASAALVAGERQLLSVVAAVDPTGDAARDLVQNVRDLPAPGPVLVGGQSASLVDTTASLAEATPWAVAAVVVVSLVALFLLLGSVVLPVVSLLLSLLSLGATFGLLVWVFQDGNGADLLGVTATGTLNSTFPVLITCVAFGLTMDYAVFFLSRIRELRDAGVHGSEAVHRAGGRAGGVVAMAALLIAVVFAGIATSSISNVVLLGVGLLTAVLSDAFVVRPVLMPAVLALLGERAWWAPAPLARLHARFGLREH